MKNFSKIFALVVAISAIVILVFQVIDFFHMMVEMTTFESEGSRSSLVFDSDGFVSWFPFISSLNVWWSWITKILSVIFVVWLLRKSRTTEENGSLAGALLYWGAIYVAHIP